MMRLRNLTMSENPTLSNREASRKTVGEVVTVWIRSFRFVRGTSDYSVAIGASPTMENGELCALGFVRCSLMVRAKFDARGKLAARTKY
jgi:hypothetical protein